MDAEVLGIYPSGFLRQIERLGHSVHLDGIRYENRKIRADVMSDGAKLGVYSESAKSGETTVSYRGSHPLSQDRVHLVYKQGRGKKGRFDINNKIQFP